MIAYEAGGVYNELIASTERIIVDEILYRPISKMCVIEVFGEKYAERIYSPNLYVVKTKYKFDLDRYAILSFEYDGILITLNEVSIKQKEDMNFLECRFWEEEVIEN